MQVAGSHAVQAAACFFPPTDFLNYGRPGESAVGEGVLKDFQSAFGDIPTEPEAKRRFAESISPYYHVQANVPPIFIIHGDADALVPIQQARRFLDKVKEVGGQGKLDTRAGQLHGWPNWEADISLFADWFDQHLRPGGTLVYATCTFRREEDEAVALAVEAAHPALERLRPDAPAACLTAEGFLRTWPHRHGCDGFFAAAWRLRG